MARGVAAGVVYACAAFAVGFAVGAVRVMIVEPRLGSVAAVAVELPLMLGISWFIAREVVRLLGVAETLAPRLWMGSVGLFALVALEAVLGLLFGNALAVQLADYASVRGVLTLLGQLGFALIPLFV